MTFWYRDGDLNTKFFHAAATTMRKMNIVGHLEDEGGVVCQFEDGMRHIMRDYFTQHFQKSNGLRENVIKLVPSTITGEDNDMSIAPFTAEEFPYKHISVLILMDSTRVSINIFGIHVVMKYIKQNVND